MLVRGAVPRADRLITADAAAAMMGPGGTTEELDSWLQSRLVDAEVTACGALAVFHGDIPPASAGT